MVGLDMFSTEARVGNMASEVVLDPIAKDLPEVSVPGVPPLLVINVQLPSAPPALMTSAEDGPGYQVCWPCLSRVVVMIVADFWRSTFMSP